MAHKLETTYGLSATELLDAVDKRFRLRAAVEGAVAEVQMERWVKGLVGSLIERYEAHDIDGHPDFSLWLKGRDTALRAECKNIRDSSQPGGADYRKGGKVVAYKVETQKTRAATGDPTSRYYGIDQFEILGVCLGKKTGKWSDFLFARTADLETKAGLPHKLAVFQRVPLPDAPSLLPWYADLGQLIRDHYTAK